MESKLNSSESGKIPSSNTSLTSIKTISPASTSILKSNSSINPNTTKQIISLEKLFQHQLTSPNSKFLHSLLQSTRNPSNTTTSSSASSSNMNNSSLNEFNSQERRKLNQLQLSPFASTSSSSNSSSFQNQPFSLSTQPISEPFTSTSTSTSIPTMRNNNNNNRKRFPSTQLSEYGSELNLLLEAVESTGNYYSTPSTSTSTSNTNTNMNDNYNNWGINPTMLTNNNNEVQEVDEDEVELEEMEGMKILSQAASIRIEEKVQNVFNTIEGNNKKKNTNLLIENINEKGKPKVVVVQEKKKKVNFKNASSPAPAPFIQKIYRILSNPETFGEYLFWDPTGKYILVAQSSSQFIEKILKPNFNHENLRSLNRQFTTYNFKRLPQSILHRILIKFESIDEEDWNLFTGWMNDDFKKDDEDGIGMRKILKKEVCKDKKRVVKRSIVEDEENVGVEEQKGKGELVVKLYLP